jgi:hypothetical protein
MKFPAMAGAGTFTAPINQVPQEAASKSCAATPREDFASRAVRGGRLFAASQCPPNNDITGLARAPL